MIIYKILGILANECKHFASTWKSKKEETLDNLIVRLIAKEMKSKNNCINEKLVAFKVSSKKCNKQGHIIKIAE